MGSHLFHPWKERTLYWWIHLPLEATKWDPVRRHQWAGVSHTSHYSITGSVCRHGMPHQHMTTMHTWEAQSSIAIITVSGDATDAVTLTSQNAAMDTVTRPRWTFIHLVVSHNHSCAFLLLFLLLFFSFTSVMKTWIIGWCNSRVYRLLHIKSLISLLFTTF